MNRQQAIDFVVRAEGVLLDWCRHILAQYGIQPSMVDVHGWPHSVAAIREQFGKLNLIEEQPS